MGELLVAQPERCSFSMQKLVALVGCAALVAVGYACGSWQAIRTQRMNGDDFLNKAATAGKTTPSEDVDTFGALPPFGEQLREQFTFADLDSSGSLNLSEFAAAPNLVHSEHSEVDHPTMPTKQEIRGYVSSLDVDDSGSVSLEEYLDPLLRDYDGEIVGSEADHDPLEQQQKDLRDRFSLLDLDDSGELDATELRGGLFGERSLHASTTNLRKSDAVVNGEEISEFLSALDVDGSGTLSEQEVLSSFAPEANASTARSLLQGEALWCWAWKWKTMMRKIERWYYSHRHRRAVKRVFVVVAAAQFKTRVQCGALPTSFRLARFDSKTGDYSTMLAVKGRATIDHTPSYDVRGFDRWGQPWNHPDTTNWLLKTPDNVGSSKGFQLYRPAAGTQDGCYLGIGFRTASRGNKWPYAFCLPETDHYSKKYPGNFQWQVWGSWEKGVTLFNEEQDCYLEQVNKVDWWTQDNPNEAVVYCWPGQHNIVDFYKHGSTGSTGVPSPQSGAWRWMWSVITKGEVVSSWRKMTGPHIGGSYKASRTLGTTKTNSHSLAVGVSKTLSDSLSYTVGFEYGGFSYGGTAAAEVSTTADERETFSSSASSSTVTRVEITPCDDDVTTSNHTWWAWQRVYYAPIFNGNIPDYAVVWVSETVCTYYVAIGGQFPNLPEPRPKCATAHECKNPQCSQCQPK